MDSSYVIKVLQGNLHISVKKIENFKKLCNFSDKEGRYFETLVYFCKAKTEKERKIYFEKLFTISRVKSKKIEKFQYEFFQKWYYSAIWSLLNFYTFREDYTELAEKLTPSISIKEAKQSIKLLEKLGLIKQNTNGTYAVYDLNISTGKEWKSLAINQYQKEMIILAEEAIQRFKKEERNISTVTMNIAEKALPEIDELVSKFRETLIQLVNSFEDSQDDRVYQLNIQLFPLTKKQGGKK
jgi:uncharacterized protein (TIGR02147 family)